MGYCAETIEKISSIYSSLEEIQNKWSKDTHYCCTFGCGCCCHNFEPFIMNSEALFLASWLLENKAQVAQDIINGTYLENNKEKYQNKTCIFYSEDTPYHCTVYGGRTFICRLFGLSSFHDKNGKTVFRPCKFFKKEDLEKISPNLDHRQYTEEEINKILGSCPPVMSDIMEQGVEVTPNQTETFPLREILPKAIEQLLFERKMEEQSS
ncbi:MAG: YkgJ family cysteine cluster protein [Sphaerochaetaceae bacterium]|nr:YkgJ family cysteine cluster protein [Sphaerochaetaceae bacterium]